MYTLARKQPTIIEILTRSWSRLLEFPYALKVASFEMWKQFKVVVMLCPEVKKYGGKYFKQADTLRWVVVRAKICSQIQL